MLQALEQARIGLGHTRPNPAVGAVVVKAKRVVGVGYHRKAGEPHAEADALARAGAAARGGTLYVTLEPCCHTGRTGPCTETVIKAAVARVVIGCRDINPKVNGGGIAQLQKAGIRVDVGCLQDECLALNKAFFCWIAHQRPLVTLKFAATLDGIIGHERAPGAPPHVHLITGEESRAYVHELRALHHAILVGQGTAADDDPQLTVRAKSLPPGGSRDLLAVVLDTQLRTPPTARVFAKRRLPPLFFAAATNARATTGFLQRKQHLESAGAQVVLLPPSPTGIGVDLAAACKELAARGVQSLLVEGGSRVHGAFIQAGLVDQVVAFFAPKLAGGGVPIARGPGLMSSLLLQNMTSRALGPDIVLSATVARPGPAPAKRPPRSRTRE